MGIARELSPQEEDQGKSQYLRRHPYLNSFISDENVGLLKIEVKEYLVARFDSTEVINPDSFQR
jgi:hypothetical protein